MCFCSVNSLTEIIQNNEVDWTEAADEDRENRCAIGAEIASNVDAASEGEESGGPVVESRIINPYVLYLQAI